MPIGGMSNDRQLNPRLSETRAKRRLHYVYEAFERKRTNFSNEMGRYEEKERKRKEKEKEEEEEADIRMNAILLLSAERPQVLFAATGLQLSSPIPPPPTLVHPRK